MTKPLTEWGSSTLRALLDRLHDDRERYDRANRIVEARACELEIAEMTRALAVVNRRATEAEDQRVGRLEDVVRRLHETSERAPDVRAVPMRLVHQDVFDELLALAPQEDQRVAEERAPDAMLRGLRNALLGWRDDIDEACLDWGHTITDRIDAMLKLAPATEERSTLTEARVREVVKRVLYGAVQDDGPTTTEEEADAIADHVAKELAGVAVSAEQRGRLVTIADEAFGLGPVETLDATLTRIERGIFEQHKRLINQEAQREADLREAVLHGGRWVAERVQVTDCGAGPSVDRPSILDIEVAAAEYARSKAGAP